MCRFAWIFAFLLVAGSSDAQQVTTPRTWDLTVAGGSFSGRSPDSSSSDQDDWHHTAEWRVTAGHYWTPHLKTEVELGGTGEGDRFTYRSISVPNTTTPYPYSVQHLVRIRQASAKVTWQFLENQWIHPYLSAGVSFDEERKRTHVFSPVFYPDPRNPSTGFAGVVEQDEAPRTTHRPGLVLGGGAKWYASAAVFFKTGVQFGVARRARSISFVAGMGFDF